MIVIIIQVIINVGIVRPSKTPRETRIIKNPEISNRLLLLFRFLISVFLSIVSQTSLPPRSIIVIKTRYSTQISQTFVYPRFLKYSFINCPYVSAYFGFNKKINLPVFKSKTYL